MADRFHEILDDCVSRIVLQGESVEDCLRLYPDLAAELEPKLRVVAAAHDTYAPSAEAKDRAREALFAAMAELPATNGAQALLPGHTGRSARATSWAPWGNGHRNGLDQILDDCVTRIVLRGEAVQDCLARYPAYAAELAPHLWFVDRFQQAYTFTPRVESKVRARAALHQAIRDVEQARAPAWAGIFAWFTPTSMRWAGSLAAVVLAAVVTAGGTAYASQDAIPGDPLYTVKTAVEGLQVTLAPTEEAKAAVLVQLADKRVEEIQKAAEQGRPEAVVQASERLEKQVNQATQNLDQAAAKGRDVGSLDAALTQQLGHAREVAQAATPAAPPDVQRALAKAADTAEKKELERKNRAQRPQSQNRGGNGNNQGTNRNRDGGDNNNRGGQIPGGAPVAQPTAPAVPRRPEHQEPQQQTAPAASPTEEPRNGRDDARPQPAQTRVVEGVIQTVSTGQITVNNQTITVPSGVKLEGGSLAVGVPVRVEGTLQPDGRVLANSIRITRRERRDDGDDDQDERRSPPPAADRNGRSSQRDDNGRSTDRDERPSAAERERERQEQARVERQREEQRLRAERERAAQRERERLEREQERFEEKREREQEKERLERQREKEREEHRIRAEREKERTATPAPSPAPSATRVPTPRPTTVADRDKEKDRPSDNKKDERPKNQR